jgi:hypothetical protein
MGPPATPRAFRPSRLLALAAAGTLAAAPLVIRHTAAPRRSAGPEAPRTPLEVPEPPSWSLLAAGLAALGGAVEVRRRARA